MTTQALDPDTAEKVTEPDGSDLEELRTSLRGATLQPGDEGYEEAQRIWNGMIDRHPAVIARCAGPADVMAAVRFARERGLPIAVRGGGHNVSGNAVCEGGLVLTFRQCAGFGWTASGQWSGSRAARSAIPAPRQASRPSR